MVKRAGAWTNGEIAYLAWSVKAKSLPDDCVGFMLTRIHETGKDANKSKILPSWVAFADQDNPDWIAQDTSVWPIQRFDWRDLTLRKGRDANGLHPIDFRVHYEIVPVGLNAGSRRILIPDSSTARLTAKDGTPNYIGRQRTLYQIGEPTETNAVDVTHTFGETVKAAFNNGVLSTQNMFKLLLNAKRPLPPEPFSVALADDPVKRARAGRATERAALEILKEEISDPESKVRNYLDGDVYEFLIELLVRAKKERGQVYLALYELHDPGLIDVLEKAVEDRLAHVILSNTGSISPNKKGTPKDQRKPPVWDVENNDARARLHAAAGDEPERVTDRMFATSARIGHNKFAVFVKGGRAKAVMTGSTNWTSNGLCAQSNNAIIVENADLAGDYWNYWNDLLADPQPEREPLTQIDWQGNELVGAAGKTAKQGKALRTADAQPSTPRDLGAAGTGWLWRSPNTPQSSVPSSPVPPPEPPDLAEVYQLMRDAKDAIFFLSFLPGVFGKNNIIGVASEIAAKPDGPLVLGAISAPKALPIAEGQDFDATYVDDKGRTKKLPKPAIWWPQGQDGRIVMVRATAVRIPFGNFRPELLTAGNAIIHDKIIVIDPCDEDRCAVITGSHNLGFKASYCNDDNMLIIRGNRELAIAYAVHVIDLYDHYVMRARLEQNLRDKLQRGEIHSFDEAAADPAQRTAGLLRLDNSWQDDFLGPETSLHYFLRHAEVQ
jgi:phosphatidylserine/phosphatidylglycerophosphate/cardiolipin synthase-like enzyme